MPLTRYQIRSEYGLADPELYKSAERDDPEALLEGVAMAGLVGVLRQLGDLAEFAAEIFHDLHEEVMATAARGHGLVARVQQLESDFPSIEKAFLSQTSHSPLFSAPGVDWHPNLRSEQNLVTRGDLPRFVMDSYEECRGPPRLFLLDKFDVAGAGACLKRYTDPSFFKVEAKSHEVPTGDVQREKKTRKVKKKAARMRNGETSGIAPTSHSKLHQLLMEERIENGSNNPARAVKIKKRHFNGYPFDSKTGKSYMMQFVETPSPEHKVVREVPVSPPRLKFRSSSTSKTAKDVSEINAVNHVRKSPQRNERSCSPPYAPEVRYKPSIDDVKEEVVNDLSEVVPVLSSDGETDETHSSPPEVMDKKIDAVGANGGKEGSVDGYPFDDVTSEVDNYMDALTTMESEMESGNEHRIKNDLGFLNLEKHGMDSDAYEEHLKFQTVLADSQSIANSSASADDNGSFKKGISSISFSDTSTSNLAKNAPSDGDGADNVSSSNEPCIAEFMEAPSNKLSTSDILESKSDELDVPNDEYIEKMKIPDTRESSPSNKLSTKEIVEPKSDELEVPNDTYIEIKIPDTRATSCGSAELIETLSNCTRFGIISSNTDETEINLAYSSDVFSSVPSQNEDHTLCAVPDHINAVNKLDNGGPDVISDAPLHFSNVSEGGHEKKGSDYYGSEVLQVIDTDRHFTEDIDSGEIGALHSVSPTDEVQLLFSALPEVEASSVVKLVPGSLPMSIANLSDSLKHDDIVTEVDYVIPSTEVNLENLSPMVDVPESRNSTEEQLSVIPDDVPELDRDLDERSHTVDSQEAGSHSCNADDVEREVVPPEVQADGEDCVKLGDMITETVQAEDLALSFVPADGVYGVIDSSSDIVNSSRNLVITHECISYLGNQHQRGLEFDEEISPGCLVESEANQEMDRLEVALTDSDSTLQNAVSYSKVNDEISPGCLVESEANQEVNQLEVALTDSDSTLRNSVLYTKSKFEVLDDAEDVSVTEQDQNSSHVDDVTTTSIPSQLRNQVPEPTSPQPDDLSRLQVDQVRIENLQVDREQLQLPIYKDQELHFDVSKSSPEDLINQVTLSELSQQSANGELDFAGKDLSDPAPGLTEVIPSNHASPASGQEDLPYKPSSAELVPQPSVHEADRTKQAMQLTDSSLSNFGMHSVATQISHSAESCPDNLPRELSSSELLQPAGQGNQGTRQAVDRLDSSLPFFGVFPEATPDHMEMPPLPPLPPMQWRMGKAHDAPFPSLRESLKCSQDSSNTVLSSAADEKVKLGFLPESGILQPQNPFVHHTTVEDERLQHDFTRVYGHPGQLTTYSLQVPNMVNDLAGDVRQSPDSFLTLPVISDDRAIRAFHTSGEEIVQSSYIPLPRQAVGDATSRPDPISSQRNLMLPPNQLATETAADAKMLEHISADLEGQGDTSLNTCDPPQSIEDEQPRNGILTTGGEIAWYPKTSAFVPFEVPKPNGNSTMKIPRPRSPLIDAVAAHDKSTLRKVTERSRPQIESKVGERDSLLEQIRTKSFNLKPAVVTRPSIQGPKTNLKVAAILEKANAIRQALAGSDDDEDAESNWSDS